MNFPNTITSIGSHAFFATGLTSVTIPNSVTSIGTSAFASCNSLASITISNNITSIPDGAFAHCVSLKTIVIPKNVNTIFSGAFNGCTSLTSITVEKGNPIYHSAGNCVINTASKSLVFGCKNSQIPSDGSVTRIESYAFFGQSDISSFTIPEGITEIHQQSLDFCLNLESIYLPASLKVIGNCAFTYDKKLTDIYYAGTIEQWKTAFPNEKLFIPINHSVTIHCADGDITYS